MALETVSFAYVAYGVSNIVTLQMLAYRELDVVISSHSGWTNGLCVSIG